MNKLKCCLRTVLFIAIGLFWIPVVWADLNDGLVAYYPFDGNAQDASGNGNHGMVHGAMLTEDRLGNKKSAYYFDGVNDFIEIKNTEIMNPNYITISVWYFIDKSFSGDGNNVIIHKPYTSHVSPYYQWHIGVKGDKFPPAEDSKITGWIANPNGTSVLTQYRFSNDFIGVWHHLAMSFDGSVLKLYLDGKLTSLKKIDSDFVIPSYGTNIFIAKQGNLNRQVDYTRSIIDDIRIYNRALSESEIQQLYHYQGCQPSIDIKLNSNNRVTGDRVVINAHIKGPSSFDSSCSQTKVEQKVWAKLPNNSVISLIKPFTMLTLLPGYDANSKIFEYTFGGAEPIGSYEINGRLLHPFSGESISSDIEVLTFSK